MTKKTQSQAEQRALMRERLRSPVRGRNRENSSAADVRALENEISEQRALGKTWQEIATNMYEDPNKADAVRAAYTRLRGTGSNVAAAASANEPSMPPSRDVIAPSASPQQGGAPVAKQSNFFSAVHDPFDEEQPRSPGKES